MIMEFDAMSEETPCFTAEIWENGKLMAYVKNCGHGGCNQIDPAKGLNYKDVVKFDNMDVESDIFGRVWMNYDVKRLQSKGFVLLKDGKIYTQKFTLPISKLKKSSKYNSWKTNKMISFKKTRHTVLNTNL